MCFNRMTKEDSLVFPEFIMADDALNVVRKGDYCIICVVMGTKWSPCCRYTFDACMSVAAAEKYATSIKFLFVDQDKDRLFCRNESIPVGFPVTLTFVNGELAVFVQKDSFDNKGEKRRLVRQLSTKAVTSILDQAIEIRDQLLSVITV